MRLFQPVAGLVLSVCFASLLGCSSSPARETTGQHIDDALITSKVKAAILDEPSLKVTQIGVETYKGEVQLKGYASSESEVSKAAQIAGAVPGVKTVINDLRLRSR